jgi:hypothetical protein
LAGVLPAVTTLDVGAGRRALFFNSVLPSTHGQNYIGPPRRHRSFPLAEL